MSKLHPIEFDNTSKELLTLCKDHFANLEVAMEQLPNNAERSLAFVKLEECFMWCNKAIRAGQIKRETEHG